MNRSVPLFLLLLVANTAVAHKPSDSYLTLDVSEPGLVTGQWDIALRDLDYAVGLDRDLDGAVTWGELKHGYAAVAGYALARLQLTACVGSCALASGVHESDLAAAQTGGREADLSTVNTVSGDADPSVCELRPLPPKVDRHSDGAYVVIPLRADCATEAGLKLDYRLLFDLDSSHRGLLNIKDRNGSRSVILSPQRPQVSLSAGSRWRQFGDYWRDGVWHIWIGVDHLLFLLTLLLPFLAAARSQSWRTTAMAICGIVTAFTVAHSITLSVAAVGWVSLPSRWVESAIAATVVIAAINNLYPLVRGRLWLLAFGLGLIHGFGFASVLVDLGLPAETLVWSLIGFNLGVETGQLAVVAGLVALSHVCRRYPSWRISLRTHVLRFASVAIAVSGACWLLERSMGFEFSFMARLS